MMNDMMEKSLSLSALRDRFAGCGDFTERQIRYGLEQELVIPTCWLDGMVSGESLGREILRPLTELLRAGRVRDASSALPRILAAECPEVRK